MLHSPFPILHSAFCILHSSFFILHFSFCILHSSFSIPHSSPHWGIFPHRGVFPHILTKIPAVISAQNRPCELSKKYPFNNRPLQLAFFMRIFRRFAHFGTGVAHKNRSAGIDAQKVKENGHAISKQNELDRAARNA
jgi:hypothetical protein